MRSLPGPGGTLAQATAKELEQARRDLDLPENTLLAVLDDAPGDVDVYMKDGLEALKAIGYIADALCRHPSAVPSGHMMLIRMLAAYFRAGEEGSR